RLDPRTSDRGLNSELISRWREWADSPKSAHVAGEYDFAELARFVLRQTIVDGDILVLPLENGALQLIEAHRLRTPRNTARNVVHGVLLDELRTPIEYWVTREDVDPMQSVSRVADMARYPARDELGVGAVFHVLRADGIRQARGIAAFVTCFEPAEMHDDIQVAKLVQQKVCSTYAVLRERPPDADLEDDDEV